MTIDLIIVHNKTFLFLSDVPMLFNNMKTLPPANKNIEFSQISRDSKIEDFEPKKVEKPENIEKSSGRPKNPRLSALAAKRKGTRKSQASSVEKSVDLQRKEKDELSLTANATTSPNFDCNKTQEIVDEKPAKKKFELSSMDKLAVTQNITNMVTQVRQKESNVTVLEITNLTSGIRTCEEKPTSHYFKEASRGMKLLLPGKDKRKRKMFVDHLHHTFSYNRHADDTMLKPRVLLKKVTPFDFKSCPFEAVAEAVRLETLKCKLKRKQTKRLGEFLAIEFVFKLITGDFHLRPHP